MNVTVQSLSNRTLMGSSTRAPFKAAGGVRSKDEPRCFCATGACAAHGRRRDLRGKTRAWRKWSFPPSKVCCLRGGHQEPIGPPARCPSFPFFGWEGSSTKIDYRKKGALISAPSPDLGSQANARFPQMLGRLNVTVTFMFMTTLV